MVDVTVTDRDDEDLTSSSGSGSGHDRDYTTTTSSWDFTPTRRIDTSKHAPDDTAGLPVIYIIIPCVVAAIIVIIIVVVVILRWRGRNRSPKNGEQGVAWSQNGARIQRSPGQGHQDTDQGQVISVRVRSPSGASKPGPAPSALQLQHQGSYVEVQFDTSSRVDPSSSHNHAPMQAGVGGTAALETRNEVGPAHRDRKGRGQAQLEPIISAGPPSSFAPEVPNEYEDLEKTLAEMDKAGLK